MSRVYWHTRDHGTAELRGTERHYANGLARDIGLGIAWPGVQADERMKPAFVDPPSYLEDSGDLPRWESAARIWLNLDGVVMVYGEPTPFGDLALNTLVTMNRPLRLLAWMHGLCESHGYFEPDAHAALYDTIAEGLADKILRPEAGWDAVMELIASVGGSGPIVWSYSASESFPDRWLLRPPRHPDETDEAYEARAERFIYDELSAEDAWDQGIALLREQEWPVALHPDVEQGFLSGKTLFDFVDSRDRVLAET